MVRINLAQTAPIITKWIFAEQKGLTRTHTAGICIRLYFERTWDNFALGYITTDTWSWKCKEFFLSNWSKFAELRLIENLRHELWHCSVPIFRSRRYRIVWVSQKKGDLDLDTVSRTKALLELLSNDMPMNIRSRYFWLVRFKKYPFGNQSETLGWRLA